MSTRGAISAFVAVTSLLCLGSPAAAGSISAGKQNSWGKSGVSLEQYAADSAECAGAAANMDLSGTGPAQALASMYVTPSGHWAYRRFDIYASYRLPAPEVHLNRLATIMRRELERCLTERGYVRFKLTDEQYEVLDALEPGSDERRAYLHSLASDPTIVARQAISDS